VLASLLEDKLRNCGVDPVAAGISSKTLTNKLVVLKTERQQKSKAMPEYYETRDSLRRRLLERIQTSSSESPSPIKKKKKGAPPPPVPASPTRKPRPTSSKKKKAAAAALPAGQVLTKSSPQPKKTYAEVVVSSEPSSPAQKPSRKPGPSGETKASVHQQPPSKDVPPPVAAPRKPTAADLDLDDDDDLTPWDTEEEDEEITPVTPMNKAGGVTQVKRQQNVIDDLSEWDDDDIDDILAVGGDEPKHGTGKVAALTNTIQNKLTGRNVSKPPAGSVNLGPTSTKIEDFDLSDEDLEEVSSLGEDLSPLAAPRPSAGTATRSTGGLRQSTTTNSTKSGGTSVWGSAGKSPTTAGTNNISGDWDDDLELDEITM